MGNKNKIKLTAVSLLTALLFSFIQTSAQPQAKPKAVLQHQELINWMTFEKAVEMTKKKPRHIIIDVYTAWCGPCKMMSKNTFENPQIAKYINENYYAVKFDAEIFDTVKFTVNVPDSIKDKSGKFLKMGVKKQKVVYVNPAPKGTPRSAHQFASSILDGKLSYPSIVFLNDKVQRIDIIKGYQTPQQFEPIIKFLGSGAYNKMKFEEYLKTFKSELKN